MVWQTICGAPPERRHRDAALSIDAVTPASDDGRVPVPLLIVTGPVGVGKSTVANEIGLLLIKAGIPNAVVDFDMLSACYPRKHDDRWGSRLAFRNLAAIWRNYYESGARRLTVARVIESREELDGFREAVPGAQIVVARLRAAPETLRRRVIQRGVGLGTDWHLNRAPELARIMDDARVEDVLVDTDARSLTEVAQLVLKKIDWLAAAVENAP